MYKAIIFLLGLLAVAATAGLLGGYEVVDVDDEGVVTAAGEASRQLSKNFSAKYHHKLAKVLKAKRQVVAGYNYQMDIIVGMTECKKSEIEYDEAVKPEKCGFQDNVSTYKKCTVTVYRGLDDKHKLVTSGCILASKKDL